jgi:MtN3 and saliva related transmembrane protein
MLETIFGILASIVASIRLIPQLYTTLKTKTTTGISLLFLILLVLQAALLICYGLTKPDPYILTMNIIPLTCACILLHLKVKYSYQIKYTLKNDPIYTPT